MCRQVRFLRAPVTIRCEGLAEKAESVCAPPETEPRETLQVSENIPLLSCTLESAVFQDGWQSHEQILLQQMLGEFLFQDVPSAAYEITLSCW